MQDLINIFQKFGSPRVAVVGDFMLDRYVYGDADRISPEAPVPVLRVVEEESRTGGAGNVAAAVMALGGKASCIGFIGKDAAGEQLKHLLLSINAGTSSLISLNAHPTIVKTRYVGLARHRHAQQVMRVDNEPSGEISLQVHAAIKAGIRSEINSCDVFAIEDYNKGILNDTNTPELIAIARSAGIPVIVDPASIPDYRRYLGATLITPNRYEAERASGVRITDESSLKLAGERLILATDAQAVVIKLDREGAYLLQRDGSGQRIPTRPRSVYDVTGAGDQVLAMLAVAVAEKCPLDQAVALANIAGGLEVERFGVVPIRRDEIVDELRRMIGVRGGKVMERSSLAEELRRRRRKGETVVFTNGCFDLIHVGHVRYLQHARQLGNCLVVAINSDDSVHRLKGPTRPVIGEIERAEMLAALECVDYVTVFDEDTPCELLEILKPNMLVKGGTTAEVVGKQIVEGYGGKVMTLEAVEGMSTTNIINRILEGNSK